MAEEGEREGGGAEGLGGLDIGPGTCNLSHKFQLVVPSCDL